MNGRPAPFRDLRVALTTPRVMAREAPASSREVSASGIPVSARFRTPLTVNAFYLACNAGLGAVLGSAFWFVAAHRYSPGAIGLASSAVGVLLLLATFCDLGLDYAQMHFASSNPRDAVPIANLAITVGGLASVVAVLFFLGGLGIWTPRLLRFNDFPAVVLVFLLAAPAYTIGSLLDATLIAQGRSHYVVIKNGAANLLRFPLVLGCAVFGAAGLFAGMSGAVALVALLSVPALRWVLPGYRYVPTLDLVMLRRVLPYGVKNHAVNIVSSLPSLLLPMIVLDALGATGGGYFAIAWLMQQPITMVQASMSSALLSEGSRVGPDYMGEVRRASALMLPAVTGIVILGCFLARPTLGFFGATYAAHGTALLRLLLVSTVPGTVNSLFQSRCRIERRTVPIAWLAAGSTGITLASLYLILPHWRLAGIGAAVIAGQAVPALWTSTRLLKTSQR